MRSRTAGLVALLLAASLTAMLPTSLAQEAADATAPLPLLEDPAGDSATKADPAPPVTMPPGTTYDTLDLRALTAVETPTEVQLTLAVTAIDPNALQIVLSSVEYLVRFQHGQAYYSVRIFAYATPGGGAQYIGQLETFDPARPDDFGAYVAGVPVTADSAARTLTVTLPRDLLIDEEGSPPYPGRLLEGFTVTASFLGGGTIMINGQFVSTLPGVVDRMPDAGAGLVPLPFQYGIVQTGSLRLSSEEPFRSSNGEATTFVFRVNATNLAPQEQLAEFVIVGAPAAWDVRTPGLVRLPANGTQEFPVIVRTAFMHAHGSATAFNVELVSQDDPSSVGRVQIGLRYPKIAQPAGHHNTVYLHDIDTTGDPAAMALATALHLAVGGDIGRFLYFNTALPEDDDQDSSTPVTGRACDTQVLDNETVTTTYCWEAPLLPGLEMGLDLDLATQGHYKFPIHSLAPLPGARMQGELVYYPPLPEPDPNSPEPFIIFPEPVTIALLDPSARTEVGANGDATFEGTITALEAGDLITYQRGAYLGLEISLLSARPDNTFLGPRLEPDLVPGGELTLPLLEYEDPVDESFQALGSVHLLLDGESHRDANPGDTLVYRVTVHNAANGSHAFQALLVGSNLAWARIVEDPTFRLAAGDSRGLTVAVTVPEDALDDDRADLVLEVTARDDISARGIVRLVTTADTDAEHEDEASLLGSDAHKAKDTPTVALVPLLAVLAAVAWATRRRK
jgi:hypothetical protein